MVVRQRCNVFFKVTASTSNHFWCI